MAGLVVYGGSAVEGASAGLGWNDAIGIGIGFISMLGAHARPCFACLALLCLARAAHACRSTGFISMLGAHLRSDASLFPCKSGFRMPSVSWPVALCMPLSPPRQLMPRSACAAGSS